MRPSTLLLDIYSNPREILDIIYLEFDKETADHIINRIYKRFTKEVFNKLESDYYDQEANQFNSCRNNETSV